MSRVYLGEKEKREGEGERERERERARERGGRERERVAFLSNAHEQLGIYKYYLNNFFCSFSENQRAERVLRRWSQEDWYVHIHVHNL